MACERQILGVIGSAVLLCDDVLDVMLQFAVLLPQPAVFTTLGSTTTDKVPRRRVHVFTEPWCQAAREP